MVLTKKFGGDVKMDMNGVLEFTKEHIKQEDLIVQFAIKIDEKPSKLHIYKY